jgi:hypothetical protein
MERTMIQGMIIKKVAEIVIKQVFKKYNLSKMKKYVEEPNDADDRIDKLELEVHALKRYSHKQADFVCMKCGCKAKRIAPKRKRRK